MFPNLASQRRTALSSICLKTGSSAPGDELMTRRTSAAAASRSWASFSSRVSREISEEPRLRTPFGALLRVGADFGGTALDRLRLALERSFIAASGQAG